MVFRFVCMDIFIIVLKTINKYDDKRGIHIIGAGTFGTPTREQRTGIPLQYNLLTFDSRTHTITVELAKKKKSMELGRQMRVGVI